MSDAKDHMLFSRLLDRAMRILAARDHSEAELRRKLSFVAEYNAFSASGRKADSETPPQEQIDDVVAWCYENRYLNDADFARRYIASLSRKGYGPQRIRMKLGEKGVNQTLINEALSGAEVDWGRKAYEVAERKFGLPFPSDWKEKAKVQRYLITRGYLTEDIRSIFSNFDD
ncbi:regulatory protein RecX [Erwinia psidii]|uniref:Regulatory protein RecX n=1 Tax=Erwinia psidii TaxID=69224 RepID=A0A3N6RVT2_9GAMM|nr:regulatory protein RecX [Erwinia psidii]MCX8958094.1 regulatory protein RecX [Erwinia psidii]MCX8962494.1 regulatory protein RecX [Erwinia psidii]MCX8966372.1 regulatory protein RecX [Erwinia psidii]RQM37074.1 regulatory protein RecX [Erwinia psidii]